MTESKSDKTRVVDYLTRLMSGRFFQIDDLEAMTVQDLKEDTPLQDIESSVLEAALAEFKEKYKSEIFKDSGEN